ncbi:hypothetical protein G6011_00162 [Alternaria panax]|uniref:Uncharacterized protein n=1 Tax=Alternaria panax TaxID=48097 RepID=A0AAD4IHQ1_9PLEO|nr:hypothetical protein G6011_00162 [Alternaria panax]
MLRLFDEAQHTDQPRPLSASAGSIPALPQSFLLVTGETISTSSEPSALSSTLSSVLGSTPAPIVCTTGNPSELAWPLSIPGDRPVISGIYRLLSSTRNTEASGLTSGVDSAIDVRRRVVDFAFESPLSTVIVAALPGTFLLVARQLPDTWASRYQTSIANALHFVALASCANHRLEAGDLVVLVFVMVAFDVFQRVLAAGATTGNPDGESALQPRSPSSSETLRKQTHSDLANANTVSDLKTSAVEDEDFEPIEPFVSSQSGASDTKTTAVDPKDSEIVRLQRSLTESKTAHKAREVQLRITKEELHKARDALNQTFAEYSSLREQLKITKQNLGRDHQAIVYRKDIELFALRKGNEQKDKNIQDRDNQLEEMVRQHRTIMEVKDAQLKLMRERLISMERQSSPRFSEDAEDGANALEVRLLRVRKGRSSPEVEEDKDVVIAKLQQQLAANTKTNEEVVNQSAELQRAWDMAKKIQKALKEERERHTQTREQLEEAAVKLTEAEPQPRSRANSVVGRLPTIDEDEHDKDELEAMFNTTQQDNLRLYAEVAALEKRLSDANARLFAVVQEADAYRVQLNQEKEVNEDMETARPSVVHRVHFQRMEGQMSELREALASKDEEMELLRNTITEKDHYVKDIQGELDAAASFHTQDQDEIERLKQSINELQATKYQLMLDHERLGSQRTRQRVISMERPDRSSARSSGATLIHELSPPLTNHAEEALPVETLPTMPVVPEREGSIQETPQRHLRSKSSPKETPNRWSLMSHDVPPAELRELKSSRRRSLGLKVMMQKIVRKNQEADSTSTDAAKTQSEQPVKKEESKLRRVLAPKDKNLSIRPSTAASAIASKPVGAQPFATPKTSPLPQAVRPPNPRRNSPATPRYYATQSATDQVVKSAEKENEEKKERPRSAMGGEPTKPKSRLSWSATQVYPPLRDDSLVT